MGFWSGVKGVLGIGGTGAANTANKANVNQWNKLDIPTATNQLAGYQTDPAVLAAQKAALQGTQKIATGTGLDAQAQAQLYQAQQQNAAQERGQREALQANARARGVGGSGLEYASELANQQGSATRGANEGFNAAALGAQRRTEALNQLASQSGELNNQGFGQAQARNNANLAINQFNAQNQFQKATGLGNAYAGQANTYQQQGQILPNLIGAGIGATGKALSDERLKTDVKPFNPDKFLDSVTGHKYKFKNPVHGEGTHAGVMAGDLQKTPEGASIVNETPHGKEVDYGKGFGTLLAAVAHIHKKQKELEEKNG